METLKTEAKFFSNSLRKSKVLFEHKHSSRFQELFQSKESVWVERKRQHVLLQCQLETDDSSGKAENQPSIRSSSSGRLVEDDLEAHFKAYERAKKIHCLVGKNEDSKQKSKKGRKIRGKKGAIQAPSVRSGDWICPVCMNLNFSFRAECNKCKWHTNGCRYHL